MKRGRFVLAPDERVHEAEARRVARFWAHGHTPGGMKLADEPINPAVPTTLDLRWQPDLR